MSGMKLTVSWIVSTGLLMVAPGAATAMESAKDLMIACEARALAETSDDPLEMMTAMIAVTKCASYLNGFTDGFIFREEAAIMPVSSALSAEETDVMRLQFRSVSPSWCIPKDGLAVERLIEVFVGYVKLHGVEPSDTARSVFWAAMHSAYPCEK